MPENALELFAGKAAGSLDSVREEVEYGWVSGRHLLERRIDEETAISGGYTHLHLRQAQRKIPSSLLTAECRLLELAAQAENDGKPVGRKQRKEIKEEVIERLLPQMPPQIAGIPFVIDPNEALLYLGATSEKQVDVFLSLFYNTVGFEPVLLAPDLAAVDVANVDAAGLPVLNFSADLSDDEAQGTPGLDFLTWLWYFQEENKGLLPPSQLGEFSLMVDGPMTFVAEGSGAFESSIRRGAPTMSAEAKAALLVGKKLKRVKLILAREQNEIWSATVDADTFLIRALKVPEGEALDPGSEFEERMTNLYVFKTVFFALYQRFLSDVGDEGELAKLQRRIKQWAGERDAR
jgi:hypothetical protein